MADEKTFSHIAVSGDDEDDFVIHAGVIDSSVSPVEENASQEKVFLKNETTQASNEPAASSASKVVDSERSASRGVEASSEQPLEKQGYRETQLEDLKATPMSLMQKAIIIIALFLVAVFVVYYFFLR